MVDRKNEFINLYVRWACNANAETSLPPKIPTKVPLVMHPIMGPIATQEYVDNFCDADFQAIATAIGAEEALKRQTQMAEN